MNDFIKRLPLLILLLCTSLYIGSETPYKGLPLIQRPKVGLVLSGGGAKAAAHVGVLKFLERYGIPIDYIAGTSMGAVVGGLYASGYSADEIKRLFLTQEWLKLFSADAVGKFTRGDDRSALGIVWGNRFQEYLETTLSQKKCTYFRNTRIPFRCVAVDIRNISETVISTGNLARGIRASMSFPGVYMPVNIDGMYLVDGGVLNNLPVDVVKAMGADIVIAVDLEQRIKQDKESEFRNYMGIAGIASWLKARPDIKKHNRNKQVADVYIHPTLTGYDIMSFGKNNFIRMFELGEQEGYRHLAELIKIKKK